MEILICHFAAALHNPDCMPTRQNYKKKRMSAIHPADMRFFFAAPSAGQTKCIFCFRRENQKCKSGFPIGLKEGTVTITFDDLKAELDGKNIGSNFDSRGSLYYGVVQYSPFYRTSIEIECS